MAKLIIDDFVMLGRTFPQETKNNGITVCACGYSHELRQLIRIYPLQMTDKIPKWSVVSLELEKPRTDSRRESWKIVNYRVIGKITKEEGYDILQGLKAESIRQLNNAKMSLGVIEPTALYCSLRQNSGDECDQEFVKQLSLFGGHSIYKPSHIPYVVVKNGGEENRLQLREWGIAEYLRKGHDPNNLFSALKLDDTAYNHLLVVGNMKQHRNNWLIITTVFSKKPEGILQDRRNQLVLF